MAGLDDDIDRLYQIGLDAFVAERNALAKAAKRVDVKALEKPSAPAWAVNQVYWHERPVFDRLVAASGHLRGAHRALLSGTGTGADVRSAESAHREALREAMSAARRALTNAGQAVSPATTEAVSRTLEALPSPEANGRLVRPLSPAGLEALAGLSLPPPRTDLRLVEPHGTRRAASSPTPADAGRDVEAQHALARDDEERKARERQEQLLLARQALAAARDALARADAALAEAEREAMRRRAERAAAADAVERARAAAGE